MAIDHLPNAPGEGPKELPALGTLLGATALLPAIMGNPNILRMDKAGFFALLFSFEDGVRKGNAVLQAVGPQLQQCCPGGVRVGKREGSSAHNIALGIAKRTLIMEVYPVIDPDGCVVRSSMDGSMRLDPAFLATSPHLDRLREVLANLAPIEDADYCTLLTKMEAEARKVPALVGKEGAAKQPAKRSNRGRKPKYDPKEDRRIWDAWQSEEHEDHKDLARNLGMKLKDVKDALERERKRRSKSSE